MIQPKAESAFRVDTMYAGGKLLSRKRAIERLARSESSVTAVTLSLCIFFAKISEQSHSPAFARLGVMNHLLKLRSGDSRFAFTLFVDEMELFGHIARAEQQHAFAWQSVPAGASGLLIIALQVFREIVVHHETDVWFVDAHSECNCRSNHADIVSQERFLIFRTL